MKNITAKDFIQASKNQDVTLIDVRNSDEYLNKHIPGAKNIPLNDIQNQISHLPQHQDFYVICQSGRRSGQACDILNKMGVDNAISIEGGILAYEKAGGQTECGTKVIPIMRQVQISAGFLVLLGVILSILIHPAFLFLSGFVGAGLMFAGITGTCGMALLLEKMPWNKVYANCDSTEQKNANCCGV